MIITGWLRLTVCPLPGAAASISSTRHRNWNERKGNKNKGYQQHQSHLSNMDFEGQRLSELIFYWIVLAFGGVGWVIGYMKQDFTPVFQAWLVGVVLSIVVSKLKRNWFIQVFCRIFCWRMVWLTFSPPSLQIEFLFKLRKICVPDWPFYNRNPIKWLDIVPNRPKEKHEK